MCEQELHPEDIEDAAMNELHIKMKDAEKRLDKYCRALDKLKDMKKDAIKTIDACEIIIESIESGEWNTRPEDRP